MTTSSFPYLLRTESDAENPTAQRSGEVGERSAVRQALERLCSARDEHFGNARLVRNLFEPVQQERANCLAAIAAPPALTWLRLT